MTIQTAAPAPADARTGVVRSALGLLIGTLAYILPFSTGSAVLLPSRIEDIDPDGKVRLLAVVTGVAAVVALLSNIVFGALSDATRSRFGKRTPWIVAGAVGYVLVSVPLAYADDYAALLACWCLASVALNATAAGLMAIVPDRVPLTRRATVSAVVGVATLVATAVGTITGTAFTDHTSTGFLVVALAYLVLVLAAVLVAPDRPSHHEAREKPSPRELMASLRPPRNARDFYLALWGRLLLVLGYFMINSFQLYIFTDYIGLDDDTAARKLGLNSVVFLCTALLSAAVAGPLSDRLRRRKVFVVVACLLATVAIAVPLVSPTAGGMVAFACVGGISFGMYYAVDAALMSEVLPSDASRARDLGILNIATTGGQALAPAASGLLVALGAGFAPVFAGALAACLIGAVLVPPIRSVR